MSESSPSGRVTLRCPSCGTSEQAAAETLADEPLIVCRNCGDTWPLGQWVARPLRIARGSAHPYPVVLSDERLVDAVRRPLVSYSDRDEDAAWHAKLQADNPRPAEAESRSPYFAVAALCALFLLAFVGWRETAVAALPDLAGLYAALGLPVNLQGLEISSVEAERPDQGTAVVVRGFVVNVSAIARPVPPMKVAFLQAGGIVAGQTEFAPPAKIIDAGGAASFEFELPDFPADASEVTIRFRTRTDAAAATLALAETP